jgi:hypothetical protein
VLYGFGVAENGRVTIGENEIREADYDDRARRSGGPVSGVIILARHPGTEVRGTIAKDNTSSSTVLSQETDGVTIGEDQVRKIQDKDATSRLGVD